MKRKFSLNLAPIRVPTKMETKTVKESTGNSTHSSSARRDSCSLPTSPFICRRPLPSRTEAQLRAACALVLENYKPSGHAFEDNAKPKLDFDGPNRSFRERKRNGGGSQQQHTVDNRAALQKPKPIVKDILPGANSSHSAIKANTSRRRDDSPSYAMDTERAARRTAKSQPSVDRPKTAPMRNTMDSDDSSSLKSPLTSSTGYFYCNNAVSTAPTSAAFSSSPGSKRDSRQCYPNDNPVTAADAAAAEWMKQELERRRQNMLALGEPPAFNSAVPAPRRSRSIRSELREYIRPLSRSASRESMRSDTAVAQQQPERSSGHGWRSWSLYRKTSLSSFKDSRPNSSGGRTERRSGEASKELNLNRELPPLPGLDKWEDHAAESANSPPAPSTHIANLMLPNGRSSQQQVPTTQHKHRRSGSDSLAQAAFPRNATSYAPRQNAKMPRPKSGLPPDRPHQERYDSSITFDSTMDTAERGQCNDEARVKMHRHTKSASSFLPSTKVSIDQYRYEQPLNFSRKISMDVSGRPVNEPIAVETAPKSSGHDRMQKLRKVVSGWMLNKGKEKKPTRIDKPKTSRNSSAVLQNKAAHAPVVKY